MSRKREFRNWKTEVRMEMVDGKRKIVGYGAVFNQLSEPMRIGNRVVRERVMPGAFDKCLASNPDIRGLINHDPNMILGRTKSGTMMVGVDDHGAKYEIDPPDTTYAADLMQSLERGDIDQSSFGFYTIDDGYVAGDDGMIRELREIDCFDMSPVTFPAYTGASSGLRSEEIRAMFPDGIPESLESETNMTSTSREGKTAICKNPSAELLEEIRKVEQREAKTKSVDGKDLKASNFAHVGDPNDPSTWKLPIHDAAHVRNALARFNQVTGLSAEEKAAAWKKIVAAAKKFGIEVSEENSSKILAAASYRDGKAIVRAMDPDGDGDDDEPMMDALMDACDGCSVVCSTSNTALWTFWNGETDYSNPMLKAFVEQATALIEDLQEAIVEVNKELNEPAPTPELNARRNKYRELFVKK